MMGGSKPQGLVGKFFQWPVGKDINAFVTGEVVERVGPEHYLVRLGNSSCLYLIPLKAMVFELGESRSSEDGSPRYPWYFYETKEDLDRAVEEAELWDTVSERTEAGDLASADAALEELVSRDPNRAIAKHITAALLSPKASEKLINAVRRGGGEISIEELADIAKTARDSDGS